MSESLRTTEMETLTLPPSDVEIVASPNPATKSKPAKWSSDNDHLLLVTGHGLSCYIDEHGQKSKKFNQLTAAMHEQGVHFKKNLKVS